MYGVPLFPPYVKPGAVLITNSYSPSSVRLTISSQDPFCDIFNIAALLNGIVFVFPLFKSPPIKQSFVHRTVIAMISF